MTRRLTLAAVTVTVVTPPLLVLLGLHIIREFDHLLDDGIT